jgi:hypothetical protein
MISSTSSMVIQALLHQGNGWKDRTNLNTAFVVFDERGTSISLEPLQQPAFLNSSTCFARNDRFSQTVVCLNVELFVCDVNDIKDCLKAVAPLSAAVRLAVSFPASAKKSAAVGNWV